MSRYEHEDQSSLNELGTTFGTAYCAAGLLGIEENIFYLLRLRQWKLNFPLNPTLLGLKSNDTSDKTHPENG